MSLDIFDVSGQKVLLTGAGRGIGKGIALAFAQAGADVAVTGLTSTGVNKVAEEVRALGRECLPLTGDGDQGRRHRRHRCADHRRIRPHRHAGELRGRRYPQAGGAVARERRARDDRGGVAQHRGHQPDGGVSRDAGPWVRTCWNGGRAT